MKKSLLCGLAFAALMLCNCAGNGEKCNCNNKCSDGDNCCKKSECCQQDTKCQSGENQVVNAIMARRSIRKYKDTPVEHEKLETIAKCGINAPSGMNKQPWEIRVVENQELINQVNDVYKKLNAEAVAKDPSFKNMFRNAPNIICVAGEQNSGLDLGLLGENMMLAAQSLGLGTCCLGGPVHFLTNTEEARFFIEKLGFSEGYSLMYILAVGYPDESPDAKPRDEAKVKFIQ